ncbi:YraN family protein [Fusobacterium sp.]|uniref:YraN family protein n=1 Tax=Fusobacterium sp. TaxID=68766 RepID=UPI00396C72E2
MENKRKTGKKYEEKAAGILEENGYVIKEKNYFGKHGELDIIAVKNNVMAIVEVKYRRSSEYGTGLEAIDRVKMKRIYRTTQEYIYENCIEDMDIRFDCIYFSGDKVSWIKNIAWGDEIGF